MLNMDFEKPQDVEFHQCQATREGDWIVFRCPKCNGYERRLNWRTGEMTSRNVNVQVLHTGNYFPDGNDPDLRSLN
jgi:Zn finger protein HypA/HybF involved in hydrogenase expression